MLAVELDNHVIYREHQHTDDFINVKQLYKKVHIQIISLWREHQY
jgi:hypothetical protein